MLKVNIRNVLILLFSGFIGFVLGLGWKIAWEESQFIIAEWSEDPILVICPDSQLSPYRVHRAVDWWGIRGYKIALVHWDNDGKICNLRRFTQGMIFVRGQGEVLPNTYAVTTRITVVNKMMSAEIILPNKHKHMPRLLEHEMGHAFGMRHIEDIGHMMNPIHESGGEMFYVPD